MHLLDYFYQQAGPVGLALAVIIPLGIGSVLAYAHGYAAGQRLADRQWDELYQYLADNHTALARLIRGKEAGRQTQTS